MLAKQHKFDHGRPISCCVIRVDFPGILDIHKRKSGVFVFFFLYFFFSLNYYYLGRFRPPVEQMGASQQAKFARGFEPRTTFSSRQVATPLPGLSLIVARTRRGTGTERLPKREQGRFGHPF
jgi:hypothetical protein